MMQKISQQVAQAYLEKIAGRSKLIVVDVQPAYERSIDFNMWEFSEFCSQFKEILVFYNGYDTLGMDTKYQVMEFYLENGMDEDTLDKMIFLDKGYGFFRAWMDMGLDDGLIIKAVRHMIVNRINDSRDIEPEEWEEILGEWDHYMEGDPLIIPDVSVKLLRKFRGALIAGGARYECLKEIQLFMSALNIRAKEVRRFIY